MDFFVCSALRNDCASSAERNGSVFVGILRNERVLSVFTERGQARERALYGNTQGKPL